MHLLEHVRTQIEARLARLAPGHAILAPLVTPPQGAATVYVRQGLGGPSRGHGARPVVSINGRPVGPLRPGRYLRAACAPGVVHVRFHDQGHEVDRGRGDLPLPQCIQLEVEAGQAYFVEFVVAQAAGGLAAC